MQSWRLLLFSFTVILLGGSLSFLSVGISGCSKGGGGDPNAVITPDETPPPPGGAATPSAQDVAATPPAPGGAATPPDPGGPTPPPGGTTTSGDETPGEGNEKRAGVKPVAVYQLSKGEDHLYTTDIRSCTYDFVLNKAVCHNDYVLKEKVAFYAYPSPNEGTKPVWQRSLSVPSDHDYTTDVADCTFESLLNKYLCPFGYVTDGIVFHAYSSFNGSNLAVYRLSKEGGHLLTTDVSKCSLKPSSPFYDCPNDVTGSTKPIFWVPKPPL